MAIIAFTVVVYEVLCGIADAKSVSYLLAEDSLSSGRRRCGSYCAMVVLNVQRKQAQAGSKHHSLRLLNPVDTKQS